MFSSVSDKLLLISNLIDFNSNIFIELINFKAKLDNH